MTETDKYLLKSIQTGDSRGFEALFLTYYPILCKYAFSFVQSAETAEDLVSEFFMKLWEREAPVNITTTLKGYMFRSIHNSCLNYLTRTHKNFLELDQATSDKLNALIPLSTEVNQFDLLLVNELEEKINRAVDLLPEECCRIFKMSRKEGFCHKEIAQKLNISENTVKVQIYRALTKIKVSLKNYL